MISNERLEELKSEVGEDDFEEIVALFIAESDTIIAQLQVASDTVEAEELLHALKGSALNLGFDTLAAMCGQGEGRAAGTDAWPQSVERLLEVYTQSKRHLAAFG